ncbi:MAG: hypothetical protein LBV47_06765 [Bacteroidales bacterium]|nr:hypothetical protein [Bacteroidales bacterium]
MKSVFLFFACTVLSATSLTAQNNIHFFQNDIQLGEEVVTGAGKKLYFGELDENDKIYLQRYNVSSTKSELRINVGRESSGRLVIGSNSSVSPASFAAKLIFTGNGNLGIGIYDPVYKLHVAGTAKTDILIANKLSVAGDYAGGLLELSAGIDNENSAIKYGKSLYIYSTNMAQPVILLDKNGHLTLGNNNSLTKQNLKVNGTITANSIEVKTNVWSDFVFSKDYKLPALNEVKAHI